MPRIFDNLTQSTKLLPALKETLALSSRADFCVGYINLRGWGGVGPLIERWTEEEGPCRVLVGMQRVPADELREHFASRGQERFGIDNRTASRLRRKLARQLRDQLTYGAPTNEDEAALRRPARPLRAGKVTVKLFLRHSLHAKLYLLYRDDPVNPVTAFLGSSNLTFAGMAGQGDLNMDVLDQDAARKLQCWFEDRWRDRFCIDITEELVQIIEENWAREDLVPPYHVYLFPPLPWNIHGPGLPGQQSRLHQPLQHEADDHPRPPLPRPLPRFRPGRTSLWTAKRRPAPNPAPLDTPPPPSESTNQTEASGRPRLPRRTPGTPPALFRNYSVGSGPVSWRFTIGPRPTVVLAIRKDTRPEFATFSLIAP